MKCSGQQAGFTLMELMITIAIAFILLTWGVPSFFTVIRDNSMRADLNKLWSSVALARSEAIKRSRRVSICPLNTAGDNCVTTNETEWKGGWVVFVDYDRGGDLDGGVGAGIASCDPTLTDTLTPTPPATDCVLRVERRPVKGGNRTLTWSSTADVLLSYNGAGNLTRGAGNAVAESSFLLCDKDSRNIGQAIKHARKLVIAPSGRPHVRKAETGVDTCP